VRRVVSRACTVASGRPIVSVAMRKSRYFYVAIDNVSNPDRRATQNGGRATLWSQVAMAAEIRPDHGSRQPVA
jgi:RecA/RadA recombinase